MGREYATADIHGGLGWRAISKELEDSGYDVSPSRARGLFMNAMDKIAREIVFKIKGYHDPELAKKVAKDPRFHSSVGQILELSGQQ